MSEVSRHGLKLTRFFRVAVSGKTVDGREITPEQIDEMATSYNPETYGARINLEHYRSILPDSAFAVLGDVVALKAEDVEINGKKRRGLYAKLAVTPELIEINKRAQKIYTSIEMHPNFEGEGSAYCIGLAVTDSPASLGTEALQFSRRNNEESLLSEAYATTFSIEEERGDLVEKMRHLLSQLFTEKGKGEESEELKQRLERELQSLTGVMEEGYQTFHTQLEGVKSELIERIEALEALAREPQKSEPLPAVSAEPIKREQTNF